MSDRPTKRFALTAYLVGFAAPFRGLGYMMRRPGLWRFGFLPVVLNFWIAILVLFSTIAGGVALGTYLHDKFPEGVYGTLLEFGTWLAMLVAGLGATVALWFLLGSLLCGYFYARLARAVESQLGLPDEAMREISLTHDAIDTLRDVTAILFVTVIVLLVGCIPVAGAVLGMCGALYFNSMILGTEYLAYPMALRGQRRPQRIAFARQHRCYTLGLGSAALLFALVPVLGAILLTTATTGAVLLHRQLIDDDAEAFAAVEPV